MTDADRFRVFGEELRFWLGDHFPPPVTLENPTSRGFADVMEDLLGYVAERCAEFNPAEFDWTLPPE